MFNLVRYIALKNQYDKLEENYIELNEKYDRAIIENVRVKAENKKLNNKIRDFKQSMINKKCRKRKESKDE